jgi:integrase/recombinase XerD
MNSDSESFSIWLERYRLARELEGTSPVTIRARVWHLEKFFAWCESLGLTRPENLTVEILTDYRRYRMQHVNFKGKRDKAASINKHLQALFVFLHYLASLGVIPESILAGWRYIKEPKTLPLYTPDHDRVLEFIRSIVPDVPWRVRDRAMIELLYSSAIRRKELAGIRLEDLDLDAGFIRITAGKGGKQRMVPVGQHAVHWLKRYIESARPALLRGKDDPGVLFVSYRGKAFTPGGITEQLARLNEGAAAGSGQPTQTEAVKRQRITPHSLRRSCATELLRAGAHSGPVKDLLGHESYESLGRYSALVPEDVRRTLKMYHPRERGADNGE